MKKFTVSALAFAVVALVCWLMPTHKESSYTSLEGKIHGTYYHIQYQHPEGADLNQAVLDEMHRFEKSLSVFDSTSVISLINSNKSNATDSLFEQMYEVAYGVSEATSGAFDITVAPLVNVWGFGFKSSNFPTAQQIDSIRQFVGYRRVVLFDHAVYKDDERTMLDAGAIAKGFSVDIVASLLQREGCSNYLVEIGGEVVCRGVNSKGKAWNIGVSLPEDNPLPSGEVQQVLQVNDVAMATSGNYRQFYWRDGKKYSHTVDPRTGYPVEHNLLSATIVAPTCMCADAYATACMVLGVDEAMQVCERDSTLEGYFIYADGEEYGVKYTSGFGRYIKP